MQIEEKYPITAQTQRIKRKGAVCRRYKSFGRAFSIGIPLRGTCGSLADFLGRRSKSTSAEVLLRKTSVEPHKTRFEFVKTEIAPLFGTLEFRKKFTPRKSDFAA